MVHKNILLIASVQKLDALQQDMCLHIYLSFFVPVLVFSLLFYTFFKEKNLNRNKIEKEIPMNLAIFISEQE